MNNKYSRKIKYQSKRTRGFRRGGLQVAVLLTLGGASVAWGQEPAATVVPAAGATDVAAASTPAVSAPVQSAAVGQGCAASGGSLDAAGTPTGVVRTEDERLQSVAQLRAMLQLLLRKGVLSQAEYDAALRGQLPTAPAPAVVAPAAPAPISVSLPTVASGLAVTNRWAASLYGFVELDALLDSTQSFNELPGNSVLQRPGTYAGDNGRIQLTVRNSRLGFRLSAPEFHQIRANATLEMDFLGNQPSNVSELAVITFPTFRVRHFMLQMQTPYVDVLIGQFWQLFGWQPYFHPGTAAIQGVPGQIYSRTPQIRLSRTLRSDAVNVELAAALARAPQRDAMDPDGQFGVRLFLNRWRGLRTIGAALTANDSASLGISAAVRRFTLPEFSATPQSSVSTTGWGVSVDAVVPIVPALDRRAWAVTATANYVRGSGIADYYVQLSGGTSFPALPSGGAYASNIDPGLALFDSSGQLHTLDVQSVLCGLQVSLPPQGRLWLTGNFAQVDLGNAQDLGRPQQTYSQARWGSVGLFADVTPAVRLALEYANYHQSFVDGTEAQNDRGWFSALYLF